MEYECKTSSHCRPFFGPPLTVGFCYPYYSAMHWTQVVQNAHMTALGLGSMQIHFFLPSCGYLLWW